MTPTFDPNMARVLGCLIEKESTTPDNYPLSLNSLVLACNQKSARDPVLNLPESEVLVALDALVRLGFVVETGSGRVIRYAHQFAKQIMVSPQKLALLGILLLRGAQTSGELKINTQRLAQFDSIESIEGLLDQMAARQDGALVQKLPRQAGQREVRYVQVLTGAPDLAALNISNNFSENIKNNNLNNINNISEINLLKNRIEILEKQMQDLCEKLGI